MHDCVSCGLYGPGTHVATPKLPILHLRSICVMSKSTSPSRPKPLGCKAEETAERQPRVEYTEESHPLQLSEAAEYFGLSIAKVFCVIEGAYTPEGRKGVTEGKMGFIELWTAIGTHCR